MATSPIARGARKISSAAAKVVERHQLPAWGWDAKGFEFWTFLSLLLLRSKCRRILELGSGRSTLVFAEYAKFVRAHFTSVETNRRWYNKARMEMRWQALPPDAIRLLQLDPAARWYDVDQFRALAVAQGPFDFVLVDAPNEVAGSSRGMRDGETALREIRTCSAGADVVIVDDVHRRHVFASIDGMLAEPHLYRKLAYDYLVAAYPNSLCICVRTGSAADAELEPLAALLGVRLYAANGRDQFPEE